MNKACSHCQAPLQGNETFCRNCGTLTGLGGSDPTQIIRRPSPDSNSPWSKIGTRFSGGHSGNPEISARPITTVGNFVTQRSQGSIPTLPAHPSRDQAERVPPEENQNERTRIVRNHQGQGTPVIKGWLVALDGPEKGESWTVRTGKNRIGRVHGDDVLLKEDSISSSHAVLWLGENDTATLTDRDSSNGTFVDGQQVFQPTEIQDNALIRCGEKTVLQWVRFIPRK